MKKFTLLTISVAFISISFGQTGFKKNDIYLEAGGNGLFGSLNYERQLTAKPGIGLRVGVGFYTEKAFYLTIPVGVNYLFKLRKDNSFIDAGVGVTWTRMDANLFGKKASSNDNSFVNFVPSIGYRRHTNNDVMWRISLTPIANKDAFTPWIGFSVGKRF